MNRPGRPAVPVGTRVLRNDGRWHVKTADGWRYEPRRPRRPRKGRVVAFEVTADQWQALRRLAQAYDHRSVASYARCAVLGSFQGRNNQS